jgi:NAD(P)-dependent dehydrogenase (short-subunit alcohol dehydrogenase family)
MGGPSSGKTAVITGASSGIGLETARAIAGQGARVVMVVRSEQRGRDAIAKIHASVPEATLELVLADLYSLAEVRRAGVELRARCPRVDVLVNNAGLIHNTRELTVDGFERTFALNHLAAFQLTYELREQLAASAPARVVTVASFGHTFARFDWDDIHTMTRWKGETAVYGTSKLCNIWFARELARRFAGKRVTSNSLHPGAVASNFGASGSWLFKYGTKLARPFLLGVEQGARTSVFVATSPEVEGMTGVYFAKSKVARASKRARDDGEARKLWELSERLCGVTWS